MPGTQQAPEGWHWLSALCYDSVVIISGERKRKKSQGNRQVDDRKRREGGRRGSKESSLDLFKIDK